MTIPHVIYVILCSIYGVLSCFAAFVWIKKNKNHVPNGIIMACGGVSLIMLAVAMLISKADNVLIATIMGLLMIHMAALLNGRDMGKINPIHHLVRLCLSVTIVVLYLI